MSNEINTRLDYIDDRIIPNEKWEAVKDYITNLQTIEKEYSAILSENAELKNKITNLQEENERYKKIFEGKERFSKIMPDDIDFIVMSKTDYDRQVDNIELVALELRSRIDKAIELIKEAGSYDEKLKIFCDDIWEELSTLLNILQGEDKE